MYNITICIPTYKRPSMLKKLVLSVIGCAIDKSLIKGVSIIIIDNDIDKTAEMVANELKEQYSGIYKILYFCHPDKGISNVRNELIKRALLLKPDFLIFIDDDEYANSEWLNELTRTIITNNGDFAMGPVIPVFDGKAKKYIYPWFERPNYLNNTEINYIATNNLIINVSTLRKHNIWFDTRFNIIGSGDSYFGVQFRKKGAKIYWASKAIVYETIPENRSNIKWLIKRRYRVASTYVYILKLEKKHLKVLKKVLVSLIYIIIGICGIILFLMPIQKKYLGILKLVEGIGGITGLFNMLYKEYK